jgi:DNA-binding CsgD family transcriptional regulator
MDLEQAVAAVETCQTIEALKETLRRISEDYGFAAFNFLDTGASHLDAPFFTGTLSRAFLDDYIGNKLIHVDPCVFRARRSNVPFAWSDLAIPQYKGVRKSGAQKTMDCADDYGFRDGLVVPFHFSDHLGRVNSSVIAFFWSDESRKLQFLLSRKKHEISIVMIYWAQRAADLVGESFRGGARIAPVDFVPELQTLTDRERDVLSWAARGKTAKDTADLMRVSEMTVNTHIRNAIAKLGANSKTHATTKAIYLGLINP